MQIINAGTPGSGKTYDAVLTIVQNLKRGRTVCTNIDGMDRPETIHHLAHLSGQPHSVVEQLFFWLRPDIAPRFFEVWTEEIDGFEVEKRHCPKGSLIVIDEAHKLYNSRDWNSETNRKFCDWASTHRHDAYDIILITQDIDKLDKQCRSLTEWCYYFRKVNFLGGFVSNSYIVFSYMGEDHSGKPLGKQTRQYQKPIFLAYKSFNSSDLKERGFKTHYNVLRHPIFLAIPLVLGLFGWQFSKSSFAKGRMLPDVKPAAVVNVAPVVPPPLPAALPVPSVESLASVPSLTVPPSAPLPVGVPSPGLYVQDNKRTFVLGRGGFLWESGDGVLHLTNEKSTIPPGVKFREV
jgi:zona occludens toxin (predicted ATPase)